MKTKVVAKSLLFHDDKILLVRRSATAPHRKLEWDLPGGMVDDGEDVNKGVVREIAEETGIKVDPQKTYLAYAWTSVFDDKLNIVRLFYAVRTDNSNVTLSFEHSEYKWVTLDEAITMEDGYKLQQDVFRYLRDRNVLDDLPL